MNKIEDDNIVNFDEPYESGAIKVIIDEETCISDMHEGTLQLCEEKLKMYRAKVESEEMLRSYSRNERKRNQKRAKIYSICAILIIVFVNATYFGIRFGNVQALLAAGESNAVVAASMMVYPMFVVLLALAVICAVIAYKADKNANLIVDSFSLKKKRWDVVIAESKEREKIYKKEIDRLEILHQELFEEEEEKRASLRRIEKIQKKIYDSYDF